VNEGRFALLEVLTVRIARKFWNSILSSVTVTRTSKACINGPDQHIEKRRELAGPLLESLDKSFASSPVVRPPEEAVFMRQGDYWTIRYQGQTAILKATRGLNCLCYLLRHPGRDVHVTQLLGTPVDFPLPAFLGNLEAVGDAVTAGRRDAGPILDSQAKAEYKQRIDELRNDLDEAERFNDSYRAARARSEIGAVAGQLAAAVGLGGRNRRASSGAERARSTVTKRIKKAVNRIARVVPSLGCHLAARIKTGYFCSYNPHPERSVVWKF
jgi:non-specific serine/threonine protein kinase